jgi:hypothetical protein
MKRIELKNHLNKVYYTAEYNKEENWIYTNWIGWVAVDDIMVGASKSLELIKENKCGNILTDNRQVTGPWNKANDWITTEWLPRALNYGMKNFAIITSPNLFSELSAKELETKLDSIGFTMCRFKEFDDAARWIKGQIKSDTGEAV